MKKTERLKISNPELLKISKREMLNKYNRKYVNKQKIKFGDDIYKEIRNKYSKDYYGVSLENKLSRIYDYSFSIDSMITLNRIPNDGNIQSYREQLGLVNFSYVDSYSQNDSISLTLFCDSCCKCLNEYDEITGFRIDPPYKKRKQITRN